MERIICLGIIMLAFIIWITGCSSIIGNENVADIYVERDNANQLDIELEINYGQVQISSGSNAWVDGHINYNVRELEPKVTYHNGKITIDQPNKANINVKKGRLKNDWDLQLTDNVPVSLKVSAGASDTSMNLQGMQLQSLDIEAGVGRNTLNLGGIWDESFNVNIEMGVGESTIILPKEVGVQINSTKGIGSANFDGFFSNGKGIYVNDAFENAEVIISVNADLGIGEVNFELED